MKDLWGLKDLTIHDVALLHVQEHVLVLGQGCGFRVWGSGFEVQGLGFRVWGSGLSSEFGVQGSGFRVWGSEFRVQDSGCGVQGSGFRVWDSGFRVQG